MCECCRIALWRRDRFFILCDTLLVIDLPKCLNCHSTNAEHVIVSMCFWIIKFALDFHEAPFLAQYVPFTVSLRLMTIKEARLYSLMWRYSLLGFAFYTNTLKDVIFFTSYAVHGSSWKCALTGCERFRLLPYFKLFLCKARELICLLRQYDIVAYTSAWYYYNTSLDDLIRQPGCAQSDNVGPSKMTGNAFVPSPEGAV